MDPKTTDWKTWLTIAVVVLTALLQALNGTAQTDEVKKTVEKKVEKVERDVADVKAHVAARPVPVAVQP
jgi:hypothetical protein